MIPTLIFIAACATIVLIAWTVSKVTGSRAYYLESWQFSPNETTLWRDDRADVAIITRLGQAASTRVLRLHRWSVVVTNHRVLIGCKTLTGKRMVMYVLQLGTPTDNQSQRVDGGLLTRGYTTLVMHREPLEAPNSAYAALRPVASTNSSINLAELRIYTDQPMLIDALAATSPPPA